MIPTQIIYAYTISGKVKTATGADLPGIIVTLSGPSSKAVTTNSNGNYSFSGFSNGSYTVAPSKFDYLFTPEIRNVTVNGSNVTGRNFTESVPDLTGTWNLSCEGYNIYNGYSTASLSMIITNQTGGTFTGSINIPAPDNPAMTGVINGNQITINLSDQAIIMGTFSPSQNTMQLAFASHNHDDNFSTWRCTGKK